jgi:CheY-like chemotaxis protein
VAKILRSHGYTVLEAADGLAALQLATQYSETIDLMLTDVMLPEGMSGRHVVKQVRSYRPEVAILYMSGYSDLLLEQHQMVSIEGNVLQKPFTTQSLLQAIWQVLQH